MDGVLNQRDYLDGVITCLCVPIFNYINKAPEVLRSGTCDGNTTYLDLLFQLIALIFKKGEEGQDEMLSISGVCLTNSLLDSLQGIDSSLQQIIELFLKELQRA
jgi:hypothetical protein